MKIILQNTETTYDGVVKLISTVCLLLLVVFAALNFITLQISTELTFTKHSISAALLALIFLTSILRGHYRTTISAIDFWWVALILYSGSSCIWTDHPEYILLGTFTFLSLYLVFKAFESKDWTNEKSLKIIQIASLLCTSLILLIQIFCIYTLESSNGNIQIATSQFYILPTLASIVILPFFIFSDSKFTKVGAPILLALNLCTALILGMGQAAIVIMLLIISYTLFKLKYTTRIKYYVLLGFILVLGSSLYFSINLNPSSLSVNVENPVLYKNTTYTKDLITSISQFKDAPILGHGKNSMFFYSGNQTPNNLNYFFPNNSILVILVELGLVGLIIFAYIALFPIIRLFNERNILSRVELAAVVSVALFFCLSLFYGETVNQPQYFSGLPIIAVIGLAIISKKANFSTKMAEVNKKGYTLFLLITSICTFIYFIS